MFGHGCGLRERTVVGKKTRKEWIEKRKTGFVGEGRNVMYGRSNWCPLLCWIFGYCSFAMNYLVCNEVS